MEKRRVHIKDLTTTCEGIALSDRGVLFIDGALPGEEVEVEVMEKKSTYSTAKLLQIISPSPFRTKAPCPYFNECGGCSLQHAQQELQRELKTKRVIDALTRIGKIIDPPVEKCRFTGQNYGYRNKITLPLLEVFGTKIMGFFKKRSHEVISIESCLLHVEKADTIYKEVRKILLECPLTFYNEKTKRGEIQHLVIRSSQLENKVIIGIIGLIKPTQLLKKVAKELFAIDGVKGVVYGKKGKATNSIYPESLEVLEGDGELVEENLGVKVKGSLLSFFQVNTPCATLLYKAAYELAQIKKGDKVLDAYSGIGLFAIFLAKMGAIVTAIESFIEAVKDTKVTALENGVNICAIEGKVEEKVGSLSAFDTIFINPPRKGVHEDVINALSIIGPKKIVYTSCDPATLARDIALLCSKGYVLSKAIPFDMFPQTFHVETVALLYKKGIDTIA
jgi:23S rRNA (uracil1939-C5)-methyltransferase